MVNKSMTPNPREITEPEQPSRPSRLAEAATLASALTTRSLDFLYGLPVLAASQPAMGGTKEALPALLQVIE